MDDVKKLEAKAREIFDEQVAAAFNKLKATHKKAEYTFSTTEKRRLTQQDLIEKLAQKALSDLINLEVLPRIGIIPTGDTFTLYDIGLSRLIVFTSKTPKEN
jgi:hypothetical protein